MSHDRGARLKANRPFRGPRGGDEGVAVVIGTILLIALIMTTIVSLQLYVLPNWAKDDEASDVQVLHQEFADLKARIDRQVDNATVTPVASPLTLAKLHSSPLGGAQASSGRSVTLTNGTAPTTLTSPNILVAVPVPTNAAAGLYENWVNINGNNLVTNVGAVQSFRLRVDEVGKGHDDQNITLNITDANSVFAGQFTFYQTVDSPDSDLNVRVCNKNGCNGNNILYNQGIGIHISNVVPNYIVDLLDPQYRFNLVLANATAPLTVNMTQNGFTGQYAITYQPAVAGGGGGGSGSGGNVEFVPMVNYTATFVGGSLDLSSRTLHFPSQDLVLENGGLFVVQPEGAVMLGTPDFAVRVVNNLTFLSISLPSIVGTSTSLSSAGVATVSTSTGAQNTVLAQAQNLTLNITTQFPGLWTTFWTNALSAAGLVAGSNFTVSNTTTNAFLAVQGIDPNPANYDVQLILRQADIQVSIST